MNVIFGLVSALGTFIYKLVDWKTAESYPQSHRVTESQTPKGTRVGEILLYLISIYSSSHFAPRGINNKYLKIEE